MKNDLENFRQAFRIWAKQPPKPFPILDLPPRKQGFNGRRMTLVAISVLAISALAGIFIGNAPPNENSPEEIYSVVVLSNGRTIHHFTQGTTP